MTPTHLHTFFNHYRDAFNRLDGDAVADLWHSPSGITDTAAPEAGESRPANATGPSTLEGGTARLTWWPQDAAMRANMHALCDVYRAAGFANAQFEWIGCVPMGANHAFVHLRWTLHRADGTLLQQFSTGYQLLRTVPGWRVILAVAYSENIREMSHVKPQGGPTGPHD